MNLSKDADNDPRVDRAFDIATRYQENMMATRRRRLDEANFMRAQYSGDADKIDKARKQIIDRQHSRRTYMGLNNG